MAPAEAIPRSAFLHGPNGAISSKPFPSKFQAIKLCSPSAISNFAMEMSSQNLHFDFLDFVRNGAPSSTSSSVKAVLAEQ